MSACGIALQALHPLVCAMSLAAWAGQGGLQCGPRAVRCLRLVWSREGVMARKALPRCCSGLMPWSHGVCARCCLLPVPLSSRLGVQSQAWHMAGCCIMPGCLFRITRHRLLWVRSKEYPNPWTCEGLLSTMSTTAVNKQMIGCAGSWMQLRRRCTSSTQSWRSCRPAAWPLKLRTPRLAQI